MSYFSNILALDPGSEKTAYVHFSPVDEKILEFGIVPNEGLVALVPTFERSILVQEMIASYGMAVGATVFETCVWIGKFEHAAQMKGMKVERLFRREVKHILCGNSHAKDPNVRQCLIDRFGLPGTKKAPGKLYGISKDMWSALAVAVTYAIKEQMGPLPF